MAVAYQLLIKLAAEIRDYKAGLREAVATTKDASKEMADATDQVGTAQGRLGAGLSNQARQLVTNAAAYTTSSVAAAALGITLVALAAGAAGVAYAQVKGYQENQAYSTAITLTGNAAGVTTGKLQLMAQRLDDVVGTQAKAAAGLVEFVKAGAGGAENLERITRAALEWESVTGTSVAKVAEQFAKLRDRPLQASLELNQSMNYLTVSTYEQIRALEEQGKTTEAATLAQNTFADALESRKAEIHTNLGTIEKLWQGIGKAISFAVDKALDIGRVDGTDVQLATARKAADALEAQIASRRQRGLATGDIDPQLAAKQQLVESLKEQVKLEGRSAEFRANEADQVKARAEYDKLTAKLLTDQEKTQREIQVQREKGVAAGLTERQINDDIDKLLASKAKKNKDSVSSYLTIRDELTKTAALTAVELEQGRALTESEKFRVGIVEKINSEKSKLTESEKQSLLVLLQQVEADQKRRDSQRQAIALDQQLYALSVKQEEEIALARVAADQHVYAIQRQITEYARGIDEAIELTRFELSLGGLSERQRAVALEQYRIERELKLQIRAIDENKGLDQAGRDAQILKAKAAAELASAGAVDKVVLDEWKRTSGLIESSLTDALLRGFESGKGFVQNLVDTIKNLFNTLVLRPIVSAVVQPIAGSITNALGVTGGGGGGAAGLAQNASTLNTVYNIGAQYLTGSAVGASAASLGYANLVGAVGGDALGALIAANGGYAGVAAAGGAAAGGAAAGGAAAGGAAAGLSATGYGAIVVAVLAALGAFRSKKVVGYGIAGELGGEVNDYTLTRRGGSLVSGPDYSVQDRGLADNNQALQDAYSAIRSNVAGLAEQLGIGSAAIKTFTTRLGNELIHPDTGGYGIKLEGLSQEQVVAKIEEALLSANEELAKFALGTTEYTRQNETAVQTLSRLTGALQTVNGVFGQLGITLADASLAGADAASKFIDSFGGADQFAQVASSYYQNFYTEAERTANTVEGLRQRFFELGTAGATTREGFRALVEETVRLNGATSPVVAELLKLESTFASVVPAASSAAEAIAEAARTFGLINTNGGLRAATEAEATAAADRRDVLAGRRAAEERELLAAQEQATLATEAAASAQQAAATAANEAASARTQAEQTLRQSYENEIRALDEIINARAAAVQALESAYNTERGVLEQRIGQFDGFAKSLRDFIAGLSATLEIPPQTTERLRAQFQSTLNAALGGDASAIAALPTVGNSYIGALGQSAQTELELRRGIAEIAISTQGAVEFAEAQKSTAELQLDSLNQQVQGLLEVNASVQTVGEAIAALQLASDAAVQAEAQKAILNAQVSSLITVNESVLSVRDAIVALESTQKQIAGIEPDSGPGNTSGRSFDTSIFGDGGAALTEEQLRAAFLRGYKTFDEQYTSQAVLARTQNFAITNGQQGQLEFQSLTPEGYTGTKTFVDNSDVARLIANSGLLVDRETLNAELLALAEQLSAAGVDIRPGQIFSGSNIGVDLRDLAAGGFGGDNFTLDLNAALKGPSGYGILQDFQQIARDFGIAGANSELIDSYRDLNYLQEGLGDGPGGTSPITTDELARYRIPGFATGGEHKGGWRMVGEGGPELEYTPPSRIFSNSQSNALLSFPFLSGSNPTGPRTSQANSSEFNAMKAELAQVRQLLSRLVAVSETNLPSLADHTAATAMVLRRTTRNGNALVTTTEPP